MAVARTAETAPTAPTATPVSTTVPATFAPAEIDLSCRALLLFFAAGSVWLVLGTFLATWGTVGLHVPQASFGSPMFTVGRLRPAAMNALIYGFAIQTALAVLIWVICRLSRILLIGSRTITIAGLIWNLGVLVGVLGIMGGGSTGFEWLEMPRYTPPMLLAAFGIIGVVALVTFHFRREPDLYVSHWFLLAGLFWFIWVYSAAALLLLYFPVRGVTQAVVNVWYVNNLYYLFFVPVCLGIAFYFIPKLAGVPLRTRNLAAFSFWTLALFGAWSGTTLLIGGPVPAWMLSVGIFANVLLAVPILGLGSVIIKTASQADKSRIVEPLACRFICFGATCFIVASLLNILMGLPIVALVTHLTLFEIARNLLALYGFISMVLFGSVYYILPRLTHVLWPSARLANLHFTTSVIGVAIIVVALGIGGIIQGLRMNLNTTDMVSVSKGTVPFIGMSLLGLLILLAGQIFFVKNIFGLLHYWGGPLRETVRALVRPAGRERA
jgi:cytochrome c oxidase cbb3-type subunit 1